MLAAALNYIGTMREKEIEASFMEAFKDFKMVKLFPDSDSGAGRLQLCQPREYRDLVKDIDQSWNPAESQVELRGTKDKLLRMARQMFFFDEEKQYKKVFLAGGNGINDFPWAIQIVIVQLPVAGWMDNPEWLRRADLLIVSPGGEGDEDFIAAIQKKRPELPLLREKVQGRISGDLEMFLTALFAAYEEKRERIKAGLAEQYPEKSLSCTQAREMVGQLGINSFLFGSVCDEAGYQITHCWLGCF